MAGGVVGVGKSPMRQIRHVRRCNRCRGCRLDHASQRRGCVMCHMTAVQKRAIRKRLGSLQKLEDRISFLKSTHHRLKCDGTDWMEVEIQELKDDVAALREKITFLFVQTNPSRKAVIEAQPKGGR